MNRRRRSVLVAAPLGAFAAVVGARLETAEAATSKATAAKAAFNAVETDFRGGLATCEDVYVWSRRWLDAERSSNASAAKDHLARMKALETRVKASFNAGTSKNTDVLRCAFYVAEAEAT